MVLAVLSAKFMKVCALIPRFQMRKKFIFGKPMKSGFQRRFESFLYKVMTSSLEVAHAVKCDSVARGLLNKGSLWHMGHPWVIYYPKTFQRYKIVSLSFFSHGFISFQTRTLKIGRFKVNSD